MPRWLPCAALAKEMRISSSPDSIPRWGHRARPKSALGAQQGRLAQLAVGVAPELTLLENLTRHSALIADLLEFQVSVADAYGLMLDPDSASYYLDRHAGQ